MGKDLKGRELGRNISQEKTGFYCGRFTDKNGKRKVKRFKKLQKCRQWLAEAMFADEHSDIRNPMEMTVDAWYECFMETKRREVRKNTVRNYERKYTQHIKDIIGAMKIVDVKPMHCQKVLNVMADKGLANSTINGVKDVMITIFECAVNNDVIVSNPARKNINSKIGKEPEKKECLSVAVQKDFLEFAKYHRYIDAYSFILQTGLRAGELIGLKWEDIDFDKKVLNVQRSMFFSYDTREWEISKPKSAAGERTIPLTKEAISILREQEYKHKHMKVIPMEWKDFVFLNKETGLPINNDTYNKALMQICGKMLIKSFSMHILRHTFATRCIEAGMKPKILQKILGHTSLKMTMDRYVHATEEETIKEMTAIEDALKLAQ